MEGGRDDFVRPLRHLLISLKFVESWQVIFCDRSEQKAIRRDFHRVVMLIPLHLPEDLGRVRITKLIRGYASKFE